MKKLLMSLTVVAFGLGAGAQAGETEITGKVGCAHCEFHSAKSCAVGVKTADGKVYTVKLADSKAQEQLMKDREEKAGKTIVVKGEVTGTDIKASSAKFQD